MSISVEVSKSVNMLLYVHRNEMVFKGRGRGSEGGGGGGRRGGSERLVRALRPAKIEEAVWCTYSAVLVVTRLVPRKTAAVSAHVLCAPYNHAPAYSVTSEFRSCVRVEVDVLGWPS